MLSLALFAIPPAAACGGLVCNAVTPVIQEGEKIVFEIDEGEEIVEAHVQITYSGPPEEFGWIVPVAAEPELFVTPQILFDAIGPATSPLFQLTNRDEGTCRNGPRRVFPIISSDVSFAADSASDYPFGEQPATVVTRAEVGPYDATVLLAQSSTALRTFLDDNGYAIPTTLDAVLEPYIADGAYFVAIRLLKDRDSGDIAPLGMRYAGTKASIPIQLTAIAAADDMPLEVYVFGNHRAVPESYLHVHINEASIDWWNGGNNYFDVVRRAADEAGGQAFATDFFGPPPIELGYDDRFIERMRSAPHPARWAELAFSGLEGVLDDSMISAIADILDVDPSVSNEAFRECPGCYLDDPTDVFDAEAPTDQFVERVVEPLDNAVRMLRSPRVTRMTSALSASEMTVDPVFVLNPDMTDEVSNLHAADQVFECNPNRRRWKARRRLELTDGRVLRLPNTDRTANIEGGELGFLDENAAIAAVKIERTAARGEPEVLLDLGTELADLAQVQSDSYGGGCAGWRGCSSLGSGAGLGFGGLLIAIGLLRRRRVS